MSGVYLKGDEFDLQLITDGWREKLGTALVDGFEGLRVSGNAFWLATEHWKDFLQYEHELDRSLAGSRLGRSARFFRSKNGLSTSMSKEPPASSARPTERRRPPSPFAIGSSIRAPCRNDRLISPPLRPAHRSL